MNDHYSYATVAPAQSAALDAGLRSYMLNIYNYMTGGLILTAVVALLAAQSPLFLNAMYVMEGGAIAGMKPLAWLVTLAPIGLALALGFGVQRMSFFAAQMSFWGFAALMGLSLTSILLHYTGASVARVFFITAATFGVMSLYGYTTKKDLSGLGSFLIMGVIGLVIASLANIFLQSSMMQFALSALGVVIFTGLIAYDTQRLKAMYYEMQLEGEMLGKTVILGALSLYLNFINLFTSLMQLLGQRQE
jgi:uncharacterized protein